MGACTDESTRYLRRLGYNVVRLPEARLKPLALIGRQDEKALYLGPLNLLFTDSSAPLPQLTEDVRASDVEGRASSKLDVGIGLSVLGDLIGALGGTLGLGIDYTNARQVQFVFSDVLSDSVIPLEVGNYMKDGGVDAENPVLNEYLFGDGELYLITKTIKSKKIVVRHERSDGVEASVDLPTLQGAVEGDVSVTTESGSSSAVRYEGEKHLTFGFQAFEVGISDGKIRLVAVEAGSVFLAATEDTAAEPAFLNEATEGLLRIGSPPEELVRYARENGIELEA